MLDRMRAEEEAAAEKVAQNKAAKAVERQALIKQFNEVSGRCEVTTCDDACLTVVGVVCPCVVGCTASLFCSVALSAAHALKLLR